MIRSSTYIGNSLPFSHTFLLNLILTQWRHALHLREPCAETENPKEYFPELGTMVVVYPSMKTILKPFCTDAGYKKTTTVRAGVWVFNLLQQSFLKISWAPEKWHWRIYWEPGLVLALVLHFLWAPLGVSRNPNHTERYFTARTELCTQVRKGLLREETWIW